MIMDLLQVKNAYRLSAKIKEMIRNFADLNNIYYGKGQDNIYGVGHYISIDNEVNDSNLYFWIGINPLIENDDYLFSIGIYDKEIQIKNDDGQNWRDPNNRNSNNDNYWTYLKIDYKEIEKFLLTEDLNQQQAFNKMIVERLQKIQFTEDKYNTFVNKLISE